MCIVKHDEDTYRMFAEKYSYDGGTGRFIFKEGQKARLGTEAGTLSSKGYVYLTISREGRRTKLQAHRLAWFLCHGYIPNVIDHVNGNPSDNRIDNLNDVTAKENVIRGLKSSGFKNVGVRRVGDRWLARTTVGGVRQYLGYHGSEHEAVQAIKQISAG